MGKRRGFHGAVQHPNFYQKKQTSQKNLVRVPKIPSWEKEFCYKIGLFTWENFLECKKQTRLFPQSKILEWDDSAAEEAFHRSKKRFFISITNPDHVCEDDDLNPDLYIDEINWDDEDEDEDETGFERPLILKSDRYESSTSDDDDDDDNNDNVNGNKINVEYVPDYYHIRIEDIKPTGWEWDCTVEEFSPGKVLTGQIIGY